MKILGVSVCSHENKNRLAKITEKCRSPIGWQELIFLEMLSLSNKKML